MNHSQPEFPKNTECTINKIFTLVANKFYAKGFLRNKIFFYKT